MPISSFAFLPQPACMGGIDILFILGVMSFGSVGMLFVFYWPYRMAMNALAAGPLVGKPLALFSAAFLGAIAWCGALWGGMVMLFEISSSLGVGLFLLLGAAGTIGWLIMLIAWLATRKPAPAGTAAPAPKLQVWAQDLLVALVCYGLGLSLLAAFFGLDRGKMDEFLGAALYLFVAGSFGLFVAADLSRRSASAQQPVSRAAIFAGIFTVFPATLPFALLAWYRWRRGLAKTS